MKLAQEAFGPQNLNAALEPSIVCEDVVLHLNCNRANQYVCRSAFNAAAATEIEEAGGFFEMECCERFIGECLKRGSQFLKLSELFNPRENLVPDGADDTNAAIPYRLLE